MRKSIPLLCLCCFSMLALAEEPVIKADKRKILFSKEFAKDVTVLQVRLTLAGKLVSFEGQEMDFEVLKIA